MNDTLSVTQSDPMTCPRCWNRPIVDRSVGLCWPCNTFLTDAEHDDGIYTPRDWRIGKRVAVKYRTDSRYGTHGRVAQADGDRIVIRTDDGSLVDDHQDNWLTA